MQMPQGERTVTMGVPGGVVVVVVVLGGLLGEAAQIPKVPMGLATPSAPTLGERSLRQARVGDMGGVCSVSDTTGAFQRQGCEGVNLSFLSTEIHLKVQAWGTESHPGQWEVKQQGSEGAG